MYHKNKGTVETETIFLNGKIITVDKDFSIRSAIAIKGDKIAAVGDTAQIKSLISSKSKVIDLKGKTVLPGINDSHTHNALWGGSWPPVAVDVNYPEVKSIKEIVEAVEAKVGTSKPGEWIRGLGWNEGFLSECLQNTNRHPRKEDLDAVSPDNPVCLIEFSVHTIWVNSKALQLAGITKNTPDPSGGVIERDPLSGEPTGLLREFPAQGLIMKFMTPLTKAEKRTAIENAIGKMNSLGITSLTEAALGSGGNSYQGGFLGSECIAVYNDLLDEDKLNARINIFYLFGEYGSNSFADFKEIIPQFGIHSGFGNEWMKIGGIKIFADGIPPTKTAWISKEYIGGGHGSLVLPGTTDEDRKTELDRMIRLAHHYGFQVGVHAIGDKAIEAAIDAFIKAEEEEPKRPRHIIMHADFLSPAYARLAAKYDIAVSAQPALQWTLADYMDTALVPGEKMVQWPYKTMLDAGVQVSGSSDAPCSFPNWLQGVQSAVLRESKASGKVKNPEQIITREQAIKMYTIVGAWQDHMENLKGSIEPEKLADLCILDEDILTVEPHSINKIPVLMTMVGGRTVFSNGVFE